MSWQNTLQTFIGTAIQNQLNGQSDQAPQPACIKTALRPHQLTLLEAARKLERGAHVPVMTAGEKIMTSRYGVIADRVGSGKSLVALALAGDPPPKQTSIRIKESGLAQSITYNSLPDAVPFKSEWADLSGSILMKRYSDGNVGRRIYTTASLLILPHNILNQWASYVEEHTRGLRVYVVKKTKDCDYDRAGFYSDIFSANLVIVSSTMLRKFIAAVSLYDPGFRGIVWNRLSAPCLLQRCLRDLHGLLQHHGRICYFQRGCSPTVLRAWRLDSRMCWGTQVCPVSPPLLPVLFGLQCPPPWIPLSLHWCCGTLTSGSMRRWSSRRFNTKPSCVALRRIWRCCVSSFLLQLWKRSMREIQRGLFWH